jgi:hypothetical protein
MPIQIDSIEDLLALRLGRLRDDGALRGRHHRLRAKFLATRVRFYLLTLLSPSARPRRRLEARTPAQPVPPFRLTPAKNTSQTMPWIEAVHLSAIAEPADVED